jgi:NADH:ubiquinone oxidoreductase subunit 5 (subunit L)/multisubunit Na+/H+ antiporter MnhA subunit
LLVPSAAAPLLVPFAADYGSLLALVGLVAAWMMSAQPSPWPGRCARALAPVVRLGEHRFYLDEVWSVVLVAPLRGLARCARLFEWLVLDVVCGAAPSWISAFFARIAHRLETGLVQFYALSLALAATVLLAVVSWLKG